MAGVIEVMAHPRLPGWIAAVLRVVIAAIFIYAGAMKASSPLRFATDIDNFHILPWMAVAPAAFYLPWLEIICGLALMIRGVSRGALFLLTTLISVFIVASLAARVRGLDITCGCFGHTGKDWTLTQHLLLNFAILAALLVAACNDWRSTAAPHLQQ